MITDMFTIMGSERARPKLAKSGEVAAYLLKSSGKRGGIGPGFRAWFCAGAFLCSGGNEFKVRHHVEVR